MGKVSCFLRFLCFCLQKVQFEMKVIAQGNQDIKLLLRKKYVEKALYKASKYLIREDTEGGQVLLLNTITGEIILLLGEERNCFENVLSEGKESLADLIERGFLVPADCDEVKRVGQLRGILLRRREVEDIITHYNILPTTDCNARCFYCYEGGIKRLYMTEKTADSLVEYIVEHSKKTPVKLSWFGGEPTMGKKIIDRICRGLQEQDISYKSNMVSNAYLFDESVVRHAKEVWHLESIQVTLDGTEEMYNRSKAYIYNSGNPYQRVLHNIQLLLNEKIKVNIRLNMGVHNQENLKELADELVRRFKGIQGLMVYVRRITKGAEDRCFDCSREDKKRLDESYNALEDKLEVNGWPQTERILPVLQTFCCMADNPGSIQCAPDGLLGKCEHYIYEHVVGNLWDGVTDQDEFKSWQEKQLFSDCEDCVLYPSCNRILKQCPSWEEGCLLDDKRRRMKQIHHKMKKKYEKWKAEQLKDTKGRRT